jgi:hypothetical protein
MNISLSNREYQAVAEPYLREPDPSAYQKLVSALLANVLAGSLINLGGIEWVRAWQEAEDKRAEPKIEIKYEGNLSNTISEEAEQ